MSKFSPATYLDISSPAPTANNLKTSIEHPQVFRLTENTRLANTKGWKTESYTLDQLVQNLTSHEYLTKKDDARAFVPGVVIDERRVKSAVSELSLVVLDLDKGEDIKAVSALIRSRGLHAIIYSSHSHGSAETAIKLDDYRKFSGQREVSVQWLRSYLLEKCRFQPWVVEQITCVDEARETPTGFVCVVGHSPLPKYRVVLPLREPFRRREVVKNGGSQADFERQWKEKYSAVASSLAVAWDAACCDVSRAFYFPSCKPDTEPFAEVITGDLLDLDDFAVAVPSLSSTTKSPAQRTIQNLNDDRRATSRTPSNSVDRPIRFDI